MSIPYLYIPHGHGGFYTVDSGDVLTRPCIGSHGCRINCVFVCVKLDGTQCFAAHIDAGEDPDQPTIVTATQGFELQQALRRALSAIRLDETAPKQWPIIVCPRLNVWHEGKQYRTVGAYIVNELHRFFLAPGMPPRPLPPAHGVAVGYPPDYVTFMPFRSDHMMAAHNYIELLLDDKKGTGLSQSGQDALERLYRDHIEERAPQEIGFEQQNVDYGDEERSWRFLLIDGEWVRGKQSRAAGLPVGQ